MFKSSRGSDGGGECIEAAACPHSVHIRDSRVPEGPSFALVPDARSTFLTWANRPSARPEPPGPTNVYDLWTPWHTLRSWAAPLTRLRVPCGPLLPWG
ncbi:DUF397 domain-containing protein [Streptomyces sp. JV185]|nr:DUF397 domain-containing protein [Streptomyces sp. JV185]